MKILSVNAGSSSLKFKMFDMPEETELIEGVFERIGMEKSFYTIKKDGQKFKTEKSIPNHEEAFATLVEELKAHNVVDNLDEIKGIGHRVVQGGSYFDKSVVVTKNVIEKICELSSLAPLHNPAAVTGIDAAISVFPAALQTVVFDTSFHQTIPVENYMYAVPYEWYTKHKVRRYGAHGTSHKYVAERMNEILGKDDTKLITCHIGNGASISAVLNGKCVNTSMGLTPNAGLIMGSRCGDIDATILTYIMDKENISPKEMDRILNKECGLHSVSGVSSDSRDIEDGISNGHERCILAQTMYVRRIVDYIAKYYVELGGCDGIVFTAGIGEKAPDTRKDIMNGLKVLGVTVNEENNSTKSKEIEVSGKDSKIPCYVIPTEEELMIARDTLDLLK